MSAAEARRGAEVCAVTAWRCEAYVERVRPGHRCHRRGQDYLVDGTAFVSLCRQHRTRRFALDALARQGVALDAAGRVVLAPEVPRG